jgi:hypothetical protein
MNKQSRQPLHSLASRHGQIRRIRWGVVLLAIWLVSASAYRSAAQSPTIATQPQSLNVAPGMKAIFSVQASGSALRYQWQLNGADISGATNSTLTLTDVRPTASGNYRCIISNNVDSQIGPVTTVSVDRELLRFETTADGLQLTNGVVQLRLTGLAGTGPVVFHASTNLTEWTPVFTNSPTTGSLDFGDTNATNQARFYRAVENP